MSLDARHGASARTRHRNWLEPARFALLALVLVLPPWLGDVGTGFILVVALVYLYPLFLTDARRARLRSPLAAMFAGAFALIAIAFALAAQTPSQFLLTFNLTPLLLAVPVLWFLDVPKPVTAQTIGRFALAGAAVAAVTGVTAHHVFGQDRVGWHVVNPIHFGNISVFLGFLALLGAFCTARTRWLHYGGPVLGLIGVFYSGSRGPLLTVFVLAFVALGFLLAWHRLSMRALVVAALGVLALGLAALALSSTLDIGRFGQMASLFTTWLETGEVGDNSTRLRLDMYQGGWQAFLASPVYGHGWWALIPSVEPYVSETTWATAHDFTHLHNDIIDFLVGGGIIGLIAYLLMITAPAAGALASPRDALFLQRLYGASVLTIGFGVSGLTNLLLGNGLQTTLFAFMAAFVVGMRPQAGAPHAAAKAPRANPA